MAEEEIATEESTTEAPPAQVETSEAKTQEDDAEAPDVAAEEGPAPLATGEEPPPEPEKKPYWPDDWREKAAKHYAGSDNKAYERELKRLQRVADPVGLYGMYRDAETKLTSGGLIRIPGEGADDKEWEAFRKALGVPEKAEDYLADLKLENGATIGDADKPLVDSFAQVAHEAGIPPDGFQKMVSWYYQNQEQDAAQTEQWDDEYRREAVNALKEEWGANYKSKINAIGTLFAQAPGGADYNNPESLYYNFVEGRMANGRKIGDSPEVLQFLHALATEVNPQATVTYDGQQTGKSVDARIKEIETLMRKDRHAYNKDADVQDEYRRLLETREKVQAKA